MLERIAGNEELKSSIRRMLEGRRLTHSVLFCFLSFFATAGFFAEVFLSILYSSI